MLSAVVARWTHPEDHVRADRPDQPNVVGRDLVAAPLLKRFFDAEGKPEVDRTREVLFRAVETMQREELFGPQHAETLEDLGADLVLTAVASRRRDERRAKSLAAIEHHEQAVVLIVWMRCRFHHDADVGEVTQRETKRRVALRHVERGDPHLRLRRDDRQRKRAGCQGDENETFHQGDFILPVAPGFRRNTLRTSERSWYR